MDYEARHLDAMKYPRGPEVPHVALYNDGYAGGCLVEIVRAAINLLNMESGRIDCGTLDTFYRGVLRSCGVDE